MEFSLADVVGALAQEKLITEIAGNLPSTASSVADDSRRIEQGSLFIAISGSARDGHDFIEAAERAGACALICERRVGSGLPQIVVSKGRRAASLAASIAYGKPANGMQLVGITGTNGKTTVAGLLRHLMDGPETRSASVGTVGILYGSDGVPIPGGDDLTTPGPVEIQRALHELKVRGVRRVAMEVSSHSLEQGRVDGLTFKAALFTNLTRDHLDYHGTMESYGSAKARLLDHLSPDGFLVVNADDIAWNSLKFPGKTVRFGIHKKADLMARRIVLDGLGSRWDLCAGAECHPVVLPLLGDFNVSNALAAAAGMWSLGGSLQEIARSLGSIPQVPGRLEIISRTPLVVRDYAHTPDALERALRALRQITAGRLICVFGCGGDRDRGKRALIGQAADELADYSIVTSDNPRTESPDSIIDDIVAGMKTGNHERVTDRRDAIARAISRAGAEDLILLAGKGHETYQIRGTEKFPFDEKQIVQELTRQTP